MLEAASLGIRKRTTRANTFDWGPELKTQDPDKALAYGKKILTPHYLTGSIDVSRDFLRRSAIGGESEVHSELSRDAGEKMEDDYLLGSGDQRPLGVFVASDDGISTARDVQTGSATGFTTDGLINAKYSLKLQYRRGQRGPVRWLLHRNAINKIALLKDNDAQPIFRDGMGRQPSRSLCGIGRICRATPGLRW
jgi:HK97 family phage major capsid protein